MKEQRRKKQQKRWLERNAMKIMCRYCAAYETCPHKALKESYEQIGVMTRCIHSPNKKQKVMSFEKVNKKGEVYNVNKHGIPRNRWFFEESKVTSKDRVRREGDRNAFKPTTRRPAQRRGNKQSESAGRQFNRS